MKTPHTPGPWATDCDVPTFDGADIAYSVFINHGSGKGGEICSMLHEPNEGRGSDWAEGKANARLIASAPDLLAACILAANSDSNVAQATNDQLLDAVANGSPEVVKGALAVIALRAAISKATE